MTLDIRDCKIVMSKGKETKEIIPIVLKNVKIANCMIFTKRYFKIKNGKVKF